MGATTYGQASAGIRATIEAYARALDDGRPDDIVATFWPDGAIRLPGQDEIRGHEALLTLFSSPRSLGSTRHLMVNVYVSEWIGESASVISDLVAVVRVDETGWRLEPVGRYIDKLSASESGWRFHTRTLEFIE